MTPRPTLLRRITGWLRRFEAGGAVPGAMRRDATAREDGAFRGADSDRIQGFERDYRAAVALLKARMDRAHPAAVHRKLSRPGASSYGYGEDRMAVVDAASTAIAMALRDGASVEQAAETGAASVGI